MKVRIETTVGDIVANLFDEKAPKTVENFAKLAKDGQEYLLVYTITHVTPKRAANFRIEEELLTALEKVRERDGVPVSEQVRRGIRLWLSSKGYKVKAQKGKRKR